MKRTLFLAVAMLSVLVTSPFANADRHETFSVSMTRADFLVDTSACPDFVTLQPYPTRPGFTLALQASWKGTFSDESPLPTDVRGWVKGEGIDVNTGLTYSLEGKFAEDFLIQDWLGFGDFTLTRSDGARIAFTARFQNGGVPAPALWNDPDSVVCTPPTHT
jgi:hypothetical protein